MVAKTSRKLAVAASKFIDENYPGAVLIPGHENALVGILDDAFMQTDATVLVYDADAIVAALMHDGMTEEDAEEWFEVNMKSAYVGPGTPMFIRPLKLR